MADLTESRFNIDRTSTVDQVAHRLREMIWARELAPGYRLREIPLAKSFGVSRNTVRDAIRELAQEGLVSHELHRGGVVTSLDASDVTDLYSVRRLVELSAVMRSSKKQPGLTKVEASVLAIERAVEAEDWEAAVEADGEFHASLVALYGSPRLNRFFEQIAVEYRLAIGILWLEEATGRATGAYTADDLAQVAAEHREIYQLVAEGRRADARRALERHLTTNERRLVEILSARDGQPAGDASGSD